MGPVLVAQVKVQLSAFGLHEEQVAGRCEIDILGIRRQHEALEQENLLVWHVQWPARCHQNPDVRTGSKEVEHGEQSGLWYIVCPIQDEEHDFRRQGGAEILDGV